MKTTTCMTAAVLGLAIAMPAAAQQSQRQNQQQRQPRIQMKQQDRRVNLTGTLTDLRTVRISGMDEKHAIAKLELANGNTAVIDLGPVSNLRRQQAQFRRGETLDVRGEPGRLNQRPILIVDRVIGDNSFTVIAPATRQSAQQRSDRRMQRDRQRQTQRDVHREGRRDWHRQQSDRARAQREARQRQGQRDIRQRQPVTFAMVRGELVETRDVNLSGIDNQHRLAKLETAGGRTVVLDLGDNEKIENVNLTEGDQIAAFGTFGRINGRPVVIASQLADIVRIDRETDRQQSQEKTQRDQRRQSNKAPQDRRRQQRERARIHEDQQDSARGMRTITIKASDLAFSPAEITVKPGQRIRLKLDNEGSARHNIEFELPSGEIELDSPIRSGQSGTLTFQAPRQTGDYTFYCPVGNHRAKGMEGKLIVKR